MCRELTKLHEEVFRGTAAEALEHFDSPRGEVVIVVQGRPAETTEADEDNADVDAELLKNRTLHLGDKSD